MVSLLLLLAMQADPSLARERAVEARERAEALIGLMEGVRSIGMGGSGTEYRLLVVVEDIVAKARAREALGGDRFEGIRVYWTTAGRVVPAVEAAPTPAVAAAPVPVAAAPVFPGYDPLGSFWNAKPEDCDILREHMKLKKVSHYAGDGRYWVPCSVRLRSVVGAGGGHTFTYTKHRPDCPIRLGRVGMPPYADRFITWVYTTGYTYPIRAGFTWPNELRASDSLWARQAYGDLEGRSGYIRSGGTQMPPPVATGP